MDRQQRGPTTRPLPARWPLTESDDWGIPPAHADQTRPRDHLIAGRPLSRPERQWHGAVATIALALLALFLSRGAAGADPDFSDVDDILNGRRQLLRTDDLIISGLFQQTGYVAAGGILQTSNSSIVAAQPSFNAAVPIDRGDTPSLVTLKSARLFNVASDTMVSAVTTGSISDRQMIFVPGVPGTPINLPNPDPLTN